MNRLKLLPWVLGVALVVGSLIGANRLLHPDQPTAGGGGGGGVGLIPHLYLTG